MKRVVAFVVFACLLCGAAAAQTLTPQAFAERVVEAMRAIEPSATATITGHLEMKVRRANGSSLELNLANIYGEYRQQPKRLDELVAIAAQNAKEVTRAKLDRTRIVPMIKDRAWLDEITPTLAKANTKPLYEDFNKELVVVYAEDSDTRMRYLSADEDVGDLKDLRARAVANLKKILPKIQMQRHDDVFALIGAGGSYEPSLLLFDEIWSDGQIKFDGDTVVAIPARDTLLVTGSKSRKGLQVLRGMAGKLSEGPYRLTSTLFVYRDGRFVKFGRN